MSIIDCPLCGHEYYDYDYPDLLDGYRGGEIEFECEECGLEFLISVDWNPEFYSGLRGSKLTRWIDPIV